MSDPIDPASGVAERREKERRTADRRRAERRTAGKPPAPLARPAASGDAPGAAAFTAQLIGQDGAKRGLRGGPPVLQQARSSYLEAEWKGPSDRRRPAGKSAKTDV
jgi:hypothetical protein